MFSWGEYLLSGTANNIPDTASTNPFDELEDDDNQASDDDSSVHGTYGAILVSPRSRKRLRKRRSKSAFESTQLSRRNAVTHDTIRRVACNMAL